MIITHPSGSLLHADSHPAHIIRECLTNRDWGLGYASLEIGASFTAAADTLFAEGFGLSLIWQQDSSIEDFIGSVLDHIDATLFIDRRTGLWELKLIRADYTASALPLFDETSVVDWGWLGRRAPADLVNSVTVRFTDAATDDTGAVSVTDTARVQAMGEMIATTLDYPGIRYQALAIRVAERDLRALSAPLLTDEIVVTRAGADLAPGEVIRLRAPRLGLDDVVMRISEIGQGDGRDNGIRLKLAEDVFALGATAIAGGRTPTGTGAAAPPRALSRRMVSEVPYWLLVRELGHAEADRLLREDPNAGALVATGERPSADALAAELWIDPGTGPAQEGVVGFAPTALLAADVSDHPEDRVLPVTGWRDIGDVGIGTLASIDGELVRIDGITSSAITVGRGCLDTVPRAYEAGTPVIFFDDAARITDGAWAAGETLGVRLLPETGRGTLAFALAPEDVVTLDRRAIRPLPPGRVQVNGSYAPDVDALVTGDIELTWTHRDRLGPRAQPRRGRGLVRSRRRPRALRGPSLPPYRSGPVMSYVLHLGHQPTDISGISGLLSIDPAAFDATLDVNGIRYSGTRNLSSPFALGFPAATGDMWLGFRYVPPNSESDSISQNTANFLEVFDADNVRIAQIRPSTSTNRYHAIAHGDTSVEGGSSYLAPNGQPQWVDLRVAVGADITVKFFVDGVLRSAAAAANAGGSGKPVRVVFANANLHSSVSNRTWYYAHIAVLDGLSTIGRRFVRRTPAAVASFNEMAGSVAALGDGEIATRVASNAAGQRLSFSLTGPTGPAAISAIARLHLKQVAQAGTDGPQATAGFLRMGGVNHDAAPVTVPSLAPAPVYSSWAVNPVDGSPWSALTLPAEMGIRSA